jgi:hypothetical protein
LVAVAILLGLAVLYRRGLTVSFLAKHKDGLAALNNTVGVTALVIGGVLTYFRFFRGRTFAEKASLQTKVGVTKSPSGDLHHSIKIEVKNVGTTTMTAPVMEIQARREHADGSTSSDSVEDWRPKPQYGAWYSVEPGETATYFAEESHGHDVWLVSYDVMVRLSNGRAWTDYVAVENKPTTADVATQLEAGGAGASSPQPETDRPINPVTPLS